MVTGLAKLGLAGLVTRPGGRADLYLRHGEIGADELSALGAEELVVNFARRHHGVRPEGIEPETWDILARAD